MTDDDLQSVVELVCEMPEPTFPKLVLLIRDFLGWPPMPIAIQLSDRAIELVDNQYTRQWKIGRMK